MGLYNPAIINQPISSTSTPTTIASSATSVTLLAANTSRKGATIWNDGTSTLYVEFGATSTVSAFTAKILGGGYYEVPFSYAGLITGIWSSVNGNALVRELT